MNRKGEAGEPREWGRGEVQGMGRERPGPAGRLRGTRNAWQPDQLRLFFRRPTISAAGGRSVQTSRAAESLPHPPLSSLLASSSRGHGGEQGSSDELMLPGTE